MKDDDDIGAWSEFGTAAGLAAIHGVEAVPAEEGFGEAPGGWAGESTTVHEGFGAAPDLDGLPPVTAGVGEIAVEAAGRIDESAAPAGYHNRVDADGDGHFDHATYRGDGHGG